MLKLFIYVVGTITFAAGRILDPDDVLVETDKGPVIGVRDHNLDLRYNINKTFTSFKSIPFGAPPVGEKRFLPPTPPERWTDPIDTKNLTVPFGRACLQVLSSRNSSWDDEDCLYLNVYVPETDSTDPLPVMVWIYGGAWDVGAGWWYHPGYFMTHEIIVVTFNYRMGPLGWLCFGTDSAPGNAGLWDQVAALQWVQRNIQAFGGDPGKVTLAGESAGSFSGTYHLVSDHSKGLFQRVIGESGAGGLAPAYHHYTQKQAKRYANEMSLLVGCLGLTVSKKLECLRSVDPVTLSVVELPMELMSQPVYDGDFASNPFFSADPSEAFGLGHYNTDVDVLVGANSDEGFMFMQFFMWYPELYQLAADNWNILGPFSLFAKHLDEQTQADRDLADTVLARYVGTTDDLNADNIFNISDMYTDAFFWFGVDRFIRAQAEYGEGNTYQYINYHRSEWYHMYNSDIPGVSHADELFFLWSEIIGYEFPFYDEFDTLVSKYFTTMWSDFVKFGDPTPPGSVIPVTWEPITQSQRRYLRIQTEPVMEYPETYADRMEFWYSLTL